MFDRSVYRSSETILEFHEMICSLYEASQRTEPTPFHKLLERLADSDRLLRLYTQNIDTLESRHTRSVVPLPASGPWPKVIPVHGSLAKMTCTKCKVIKDFNPQLFRIWMEDLPECTDCARDEEARIAAGRRKLGVGFIRPRMVLYGEPGYDDVNIGSCMASDLRNRPDALVVVGTTLKIPGTKIMVREMSKAIGNRGHVIWLNTCDAPSGEFEDVWDFVIKGDCQEIARLMEDVSIAHKDQSFVSGDAEMCTASQQTVQDPKPDPTPRANDWWSVVVDDPKRPITGLLTPATTQTSSDDDTVMKQKKSAQSDTLAIKTMDTADFYKPLVNLKTKSLKRKRTRTDSGRRKMSQVGDAALNSVEANTESAIDPTIKPKRKRPIQQCKIVKLKLSPQSMRITRDMPVEMRPFHDEICTARRIESDGAVPASSTDPNEHQSPNLKTCSTASYQSNLTATHETEVLPPPESRTFTMEIKTSSSRPPTSPESTSGLDPPTIEEAVPPDEEPDDTEALLGMASVESEPAISHQSPIVEAGDEGNVVDILLSIEPPPNIDVVTAPAVPTVTSSAVSKTRPVVLTRRVSARLRSCASLALPEDDMSALAVKAELEPQQDLAAPTKAKKASMQNKQTRRSARLKAH